MTEQIENCLRPSGATKRLVELSDRWWKDGDGPLLAQIKGTQDVIALIPGTFSGYYFTDRETGEKVRVTKKNKDLFEKDAYCFYKPLPNEPLTGTAFVKFLMRQISPKDMIFSFVINRSFPARANLLLRIYSAGLNPHSIEKPF